MKNLYEPLPEHVTVDGVDYAVLTDFRDWLRFEGLLAAEDIPDGVKLNLALKWYLNGHPQSPDLAVTALADFFIIRDKAAHKSASAQQRRERVTDLAEDAGLIYAAFLQTYGTDLTTVPYLHWWAFRALLDGLPDSTQYSKIVGIRATKLDELPKSMRKHYEKMKNVVKLRVAKPARQMTLVERDEAMKKRAREISART